MVVGGVPGAKLLTKASRLESAASVAPSHPSLWKHTTQDFITVPVVILTLIKPQKFSVVTHLS